VELLQPGDEVFKQVARLVEFPILRVRILAVAAGGNDKDLPPVPTGESRVGGIVGLVGDHGIGLDFREQDVGTLQIVRLAGVRAKLVGLSNASTVALILLLSPPRCARRLGCRPPLFLRPHTVLMRANNGAVDQAVFTVRIHSQALEDLLPNAASGPAAEAHVHHPEATEPLRQIPPRN